MDMYRVTVQRTATYTGLVYGTNPVSWDRDQLVEYVQTDKSVQQLAVNTVVTKVEQLDVVGEIYDSGQR